MIRHVTKRQHLFVKSCFLISFILSGFPLAAKNLHPATAVAETRNVQAKGVLKGKVVDDKGLALPGASVRLKELERAVQTGLNGEYRIDAPAGAYTVEISFISFKTERLQKVTVKAGETSTLNIKLFSDNAALDEVVVVGYGTQKKVNLTGAVSQISSKDIQDRPIANISQAIQGTMPNVNVTFGNGRPGATGSVNIRGYASINSSKAEPLILIDGVPGDLNTINPRDVETISVLKDAAAAAIYGSRGAFGVMLITTKAARDGKIRINYSNNFGWSGNTVSTDFMTDGYDAAVLNDEAFKRATGKTYTGYTDKDYEELLKRKTDKSLPSVVIDNRKGKDMYIYYGSTDWWNEMFRKTQTSMEHSISFMGGTDKFNFLLSGRMFEKNGLMRINQDKYKGYNLRTKLSSAVTKWLKVSNNTQFNYNTYNYPGFQNGKNGNQNFVSTTVHALPSYVPVNPDGTATYRTELNNYTVGDGVFADLLHGKSKGAETTNEFANNFEAIFSIAKGLQFTGNYNYNYQPSNYWNRKTQFPWSVYPGVISYQGVDFLEETNYAKHYHTLNLYADYQKSLDKHNLKFTAGYNQESESYKRWYSRRNDLLSEDLNDLTLGSGDMTVSGNANTWALMGIFGRFNYDFDGKYLLELNGRYDGSSRFPKGQRFGFFPSVSVGWRISQEDFFSNLKPLFSEFKIRASHGSLGNQKEASVYGYIPLLARGTSNWIMDSKKAEYFSVPAPISPNLTWERATTTNVGLDAAFFKQRLSATFDWYVRNTLDMLIAGKTLPGVLGASAPKENAGDLRNIGWETAIAWQDRIVVAGRPLSYNIGLGLADSKAKITRFDNPNLLLSNYYVGQQLGQIWGYRVEGLFASDEEAKAWKVNQDYVNKQRLGAPGEWSQLKGGDMKFKDMDGNAIINDGKNTLDDHGDLEVIGNELPRYNFNFNVGASWANFDISAFFQGIGRQDWYPGNNADKFWGPYSRPYFSFVPRNFNDDVWTPENPDAYFPLLRGYIALNGGGSLNVKNDRYLQNLAYLRLKSLNVGYSIPASLLSKAKVSRARIYLSGENIFTATKLRSDYIDPEQASSEVNGRVYPFSKTFSFGLDVTF